MNTWGAGGLTKYEVFSYLFISYFISFHVFFCHSSSSATLLTGSEHQKSLVSGGIRGQRFLMMSCGLRAVGTFSSNFFWSKSNSENWASVWDNLKNRLLQLRLNLCHLAQFWCLCLLYLDSGMAFPPIQHIGIFISTTSTFLELELSTTLTKPSKSYTAPTGQFFICCSTPWWKLSALMKVCPCSKYLRVISSLEVVLALTRQTREDNRHQFLFCAEQLSTQKMLLHTCTGEGSDEYEYLEGDLPCTSPSW